MSVASEISRLQNAKSALKTAINAKTDAQHQIDNELLDDYATFVNSIQTGGGALLENDVNFYDYDGTLLYAYSKTDFLALSAMPSNPSHTGLIAQGWNWTLSDAQTYVTTYEILDIGQLYSTVSGKSEFDIELNVLTGLSITFNMNGNKNWGDGTSDSATSHTYSTYGNYTIICDGATITVGTTTGMFNQGSSSRNYFLKAVRLARLSSIPTNTFSYCNSLETITFPTSITTLEAPLSFCYNLKHITLPNTITTNNIQLCPSCTTLKTVSLASAKLSGYSCFQGCSSLQRVTLPSTMNILEGNAFTSCNSLNTLVLPNSILSLRSSVFSGCCSLHTIKMPSGLTSLNGNIITSTNAPIYVDFTELTSIPTLSTSFSTTGVNALTKIVVPDSLYSQWITETNWVAIADYIYRVSDV